MVVCTLFMLTHAESEACDSDSDHYSILDKVTWRDFVGFGCAAVGLMVAAGGGIGGGGILVPIYILVMDFSPKKAIPLSNVTILGGSLSNMYLNSKKRHPNADRPCIDYDLANLMEPLTIAGAVVGTVLNKLLVPWIITVLLVIVLGLTTFNTLRKAMALYRKESVAFNELAPIETSSTASDGVKMQLSGSGKKYGAVNGHDVDMKDEDDECVDELAEAGAESKLVALLEEERHIPWDRVTVLVICFIGTSILSLLKGEAVTCASVAYWVLTFMPVPFAIGVGMYVRHKLLKTSEYKKEIGYKHMEGDVVWDSRTTLVYPVICSVAGVFAGLFGIGGGIVKGPLMLEMQVHPAVASATAAYMIFFTSFSASFSYAFLGEMTWEYAWICFLIGVVFTYIGQVMLNKVVKRTGRSSYIAFTIVAVVGLSVIMMGVEGIKNTIHFVENDCSYAPDIC